MTPPIPHLNPNETTSHSTKLANNASKVAGYLPQAGEEAGEKGRCDSLPATSESPCIGHCTTVLGDDVCRSCLRTFEEVTNWVLMSEDERYAVNHRIADLEAG